MTLTTNIHANLHFFDSSIVDFSTNNFKLIPILFYFGFFSCHLKVLVKVALSNSIYVKWIHRK